MPFRSSEELRNRVDGIDARINEILAEIRSDLTNRIHGIEERIRTVEGLISALQQAIDDGGRRDGGIESGLDIHESRLVVLERTMTRVEIVVASLCSQLEVDAGVIEATSTTRDVPSA